MLSFHQHTKTNITVPPKASNPGLWRRKHAVSFKILEIRVAQLLSGTVHIADATCYTINNLLNPLTYAVKRAKALRTGNWKHNPRKIKHKTKQTVKHTHTHTLLYEYLSRGGLNKCVCNGIRKIHVELPLSNFSKSSFRRRKIEDKRTLEYALTTVLSISGVLSFTEHTVAFGAFPINSTKSGGNSPATLPVLLYLYY